MKLQSYIIESCVEINLDKCGGNPIVRGTRIELSVIVELLDNGMKIEDILKMFPEIPLDKVRMIYENLELFKKFLKAMNLVEITKEKLAGMPVVRGTRVPVSTVYEFLRAGFKPEEIIKMFPTLRLSDVVELAKYMDVLEPIIRRIWRKLIERPQEMIKCLL